ncbi:MAG: hypothetical protein H0U62_01685 [Actinobacteria bacterium]|nr:hypothetical protein [Actinomycetota bacterium]
MDSAGLALLALVVATAVHAGFQLTVTTVVYPALARVDTDRWSTAHDAHSRSIVPVVAVTYLSLAGACLWAVLAVPSSAWVWTAGAGVTTALVAAPTHGALARGRRPDLVHRLLIADRVRALGAVIALLAAVAAAVG